MKKLISMLLTAGMLLAMLATLVCPIAADEAPTDTFDPNAASPTISTAADYIAFFNAVYNQKMDFAGKTVTMLHDITLNDTTAADWYTKADAVKLSATNNGWAWFKGTFDGGNHTLKGAIPEGEFRSDVPLGIFPYALEATIKNLVVDGFYVCSANTTVDPRYGQAGVGGLIGHAKTDVTVDNVTMRNGIVTCVEGGKGGIGAVVGAYDGQKAGQTLKISNCVVEETVQVIAGKDSPAYTGGLIGYVDENFLSHPTNIDLSASKLQPAGSMDETITLKPFGAFLFGGEVGSEVGAQWTVKNESTKFNAPLDLKIVAVNPTPCTDLFNKTVIDSGCYGSKYQALATYTVTWSVDGQTTTENYQQGATPSYKGSLEKPMTDTKLYAFREWSPALAPVTADVTYTAVFDEFDKVKVTWIVDGVETEEYYRAGDLPNFKGETLKAADDNAVYTFKGWDKTIVAAEEDVTYTAVYETKRKYQITWVIDGVETKETYLEGVKPSYKGKPTKAEDADYTYKFTGWDKEPVAVSADATYTAVFDKTAKNAATTDEGGKESGGCGSSISASFVTLIAVGMAGAFAFRKKHD